MGRRVLLFLFTYFFLTYYGVSQVYSPQPAAGGGNIPGTSVTIPVASPKDSIDLLSGLIAKIKDQSIFINWRVTNLNRISYFFVERLDPDAKDYVIINRGKRVKSGDSFEKSVDGNNLKVLKYDYEDGPEHDGVYYYRIKAYDDNDKLLFQSDEIKIGISGIRNFKLEQNYPNPFNPETVIQYELLSDSYVRLKVYDIVGREITTLVDRAESKGTYMVTFDASKFATLTSGIYFYKLETDLFTDVKKMILAK